MTKSKWLIAPAFFLLLAALYFGAGAEGTAADPLPETIRVEVRNAQPDLSNATVSGGGTIEGFTGGSGAAQQVRAGDDIITINNSGPTEHTLRLAVPLDGGLNARINLTVRDINVNLDVNRVLMQGALQSSVMTLLSAGSLTGAVYAAGAAVQTVMMVPRAHVDFDYDYSVEFYLGDLESEGTVITNAKTEFSTVGIPVPIAPQFGIAGSLYATISLDASGYLKVEMGVRDNRIDVDYDINTGFTDHSQEGEAFAGAALVGEINAEAKIAFSIGVIPKKAGQAIKVFEVTYGIESKASLELNLEQGTVHQRGCLDVNLETKVALKAWAGAKFTYKLSGLKKGLESLGKTLGWDSSGIDKGIEARLDVSELIHGEWGSGAEWALDDLELTMNFDETSLGVNATLWTREMADIQFKDRTIPLNGSLHFEWENNTWEYKEVCSRNIQLILDPQNGEEPVIQNYRPNEYILSGVFSYQPYKPGYVFAYWQDADTGENFFSAGSGQADWTGDKTLLAQYEPEERENIEYHIDHTFEDMNPGSTQLGDGTLVYAATMHNRQDAQADILLYMAAHPDTTWHGYPFYLFGGENSSLTSVYYGPRVIGTTGMSGSVNLTQVTANEGIRWLGKYENCLALPEIYFPDSVESTESAQFRNCPALHSVRLSPQITYIANEAFMKCPALQQIDLPSGVTRISESAFQASGLTSITLPASLSYIEDNAFRQCPALTEITTDGAIPLWEIGENAFADCTALEVVDITSSNKINLDIRTFANTPALNSITLTAQTIYSSLNSSFNDTGARAITLNTDWLDDMGVISAHHLETLEINTGYIGSLFIEECENLRSVEVHCTGGMDRLYMDGDLSRLETIVIYTDGGTVNEVDITAPCLTSLIIDGNVGKLELDDCYSLTELETGAVTDYPRLRNVTALETFTLPEGSNTVWTNQFINCVRLKEVIVPPDVEVQGESESPIRFVRKVSSASTAETYVLRFESAFGAEREDMRLPGGVNVRLPIVTRTGFVFGGWYLDKALTQMVEGDFYIMPAREAALYAAWTAEPTETGVTGNGSTLTWSGENDLFSVPEGYTVLAADSIGPSVRTVCIPAHVTRIEEGAFRTATGLERIVVEAGHSRYYSQDGVLYTKDGTLIAVPCRVQAGSVRIPDGITGIASQAMNYTDGTCLLESLLIPDSVTSIGADALSGLNPACGIFGPLEGPVREAAVAQGLNYNMFMVYFESLGQLAGMTSLSAGSPLPDFTLASSGSSRFMGWSETVNGEPVPDSYTVPYGGTMLYAVWQTDDIPIDSAHFPDAAFRAYVSETFDADQNGSLSDSERADAAMVRVGILEGWVDEGVVTASEAAYIRENWQSRITSLRGIEYLTGLRWLHAPHMAQMSGSLDLSANTQLESAVVLESGLSSLTLGSLPRLIDLHCEDNPLGTLDVSGCPALETLICAGCGLSALNVSNCPLLQVLNCDRNSLTALDVSRCTALQCLALAENRVTQLPLSSCKALKELYCNDNLFTSLSISQLTQLEVLACQGNQLKTLNVQKNKALRELYVFDNRLTTLNASGLTQLVRLEASFMQTLTSISLSNLPNLEVLYLGRDSLTDVDLSDLTALTELEIWSNQLTSLDLSGCPNVVSVVAQNNRLTSLNLMGCGALEAMSIQKNPLYTLDLSGCPKIRQAVREGESDFSDSVFDYYEVEYAADQWAFILCPKGMLFPESGETLRVMTLPAALTEIEEEAFMGVSADIIVLPGGCTSVGSRAFASCPNLKVIHIPSSAEVAQDALAGSESARVVRTQ